MKVILTYGTYDLLHYGHIRLLQRAKALGDYLIVGLSTDEFNESKGKKAYHNYETRKLMLEATKFVDLVIPEENWEQKISDIKKYNVDVVVMGSDWAGSDRFSYLEDYCELIYLERTKGISTSKIKKDLNLQQPVNGINQIPEVNDQEKEQSSDFNKVLLPPEGDELMEARYRLIQTLCDLKTRCSDTNEARIAKLREELNSRQVSDVLEDEYSKSKNI